MSAAHTPMPSGLDIPVVPVKMPQSAIDSAIPLMGFDFGPDLFHLLAFDFGNDGGAIGIYRKGDDFCARISLDALAEFWLRANGNAAIAKATGLPLKTALRDAGGDPLKIVAACEASAAMWSPAIQSEAAALGATLDSDSLEQGDAS